MREFLTEWLIRYGTEWGPWRLGTDEASCAVARTKGYMDQRIHTGGLGRIHDYQLTPKGLEYLKDV